RNQRARAAREMGDLHHPREAIEENHLVGPVELIGFTRRKAQRYIGCGRRLPALLAPPSGVTPHGIVAAVITAPTQLFEDPYQRKLLTSGFGYVRYQQSVEF